MADASQATPFRLLRWFAGLSAVVIALIALANAWVVSNFLTGHLFQREASISREFVQNILLSDGSLGHLRNPDDPELRARFRSSIIHLTNMRDVLRSNVYGGDGTVLWSSDPQLVGRHFRDNDELDEAMRGALVVHAGRIDDDTEVKREHVGLPASVVFFVETYIPITDPASQRVIGVVELYKAPLALTKAIQEGQRQVAVAALAGALALYFSLFWLVRRADRTMREQHGRLLEAGTLAAIGELAASVAHNIRNPLASIRAAAELSLESPADHAAESARDIVREVDRVSGRVTELLRLSHQGNPVTQRVDLAALLAACAADHREPFRRREQTLVFQNTATQAATMADPNLLQQVFHSLLANASEAMGPGGACRLLLQPLGAREVRIEVRDSGPGIAPEMKEQAFRPFFTTKPQGLGLGLTLARRIIERLGGTLRIDSPPGEGTTVRIDLPKA